MDSFEFADSCEFTDCCSEVECYDTSRGVLFRSAVLRHLTGSFDFVDSCEFTDVCSEVECWDTSLGEAQSRSWGAARARVCSRP